MKRQLAFVLCAGYEGLLSSTAVSAKKAAFKEADRIFSLSSATGHDHPDAPPPRHVSSGGGQPGNAPISAG
jgi:hypothetical protein